MRSSEANYLVGLSMERKTALCITSRLHRKDPAALSHERMPSCQFSKITEHFWTRRKILKKTIKVLFKEGNLVRHALNAVVPTGRSLRSKFPDSARIRFQLIGLP